MTTGRNHDRHTLILSAGILITALALPQPLMLASSIGAASGLYLAPDLDLPRCNARRRWGALGWYWTLYDKAFTHRSFWSHAPIIGTLGRLLYVLPLLVPPVALSLHLGLDWRLLLALRVWLIAYVGGLMAADVVHWLDDGLLWRVFKR